MEPTPQTPPTPPNPPADQQQAPQERGPSPAEKRIAALYGQYKQEQEARAQTEAANAELQSQLSQLSQEVSLLKAQRLQAATPSSDPFAPKPVVPASSGQDVEKVIQATVERVVGPIVQEFRQKEQRSALQQGQQASLLRAANEFPEIKDATSELARLADQIWKSDPHLQQHPQGPYFAVLAARGAMGPVMSATQQEQLKVGAAQIPAGSGLPGVGNPHALEIAAFEKKIADLGDDLKFGRGDAAKNWAEKRDAILKLAQLKNDPNLGVLAKRRT
ncbi:MAG: hypothetical protein WC683_07215 [bacterium]